MLVHTQPSTLGAILSVFILSTTSVALQVAPNSPCSPQCTIDGTVNTNTSEVVCSDTDFSTTSTGLKFKNCIDCLQGSRYFSTDNSDLDWFLYNLRFAADVCLFRYPGPGQGNETSACNVDYVCNPLQSALEADKLSTAAAGEFGYCTADNSAFRSQSRTTCIGCLQSSPSSKYLSNFLIALEAGCEQQPIPGKLLGLSGSLFSQVAVNITDGDTASNGTTSRSPAKLSTGAIVGIAVGASVLFLGGAILFIVYYCRQRRYNKEDRARRASYASYLGFPTYPLYPGENTEIALEGPSYTLDYKSPVHETEAVDGGSEVSYDKPIDALKRQPSGHSRQYSNEELQRLPSAMPIHPAYIPRAIMRRNSPATATPSQFSSTLPSRNPSIDSQAPIVLSAPPPARRPSRARATEPGSIQGSYHSASESTSSADHHSQQRDRQGPFPFSNIANLDKDIHRTAVRQLEQHGIYAADQQEQHQAHQQQPQQPQQPSPSHRQLASFTAGPGPALTTRARASSASSTQSSPANAIPLVLQPVPLHASRSRSRTKPQPAPLSLTGNYNNNNHSNGSTNSTPNNSPPLRTRQEQQQYQHPHPPASKRTDLPLPGLADMEISGPLAFRDREFRAGGGTGTGTGAGSPPGSGGSPPALGDRRTFRDRADGPGGGGGGGGGGVGHGIIGPGAARFAVPGAHGAHNGRPQGRIVEQTFIRKGWVGEVPLDNAGEELW